MRKQLPIGKAEASDPALHIEMETLRQEREARLDAEEAQADREQGIKEAYETAGIIKGMHFTRKVVTATELMTLKRVKESKGYRGIGTWEDYCKYCDLDRHTVDGRLGQLDTFGPEFLDTLTGFGLSYRDLHQLRKLKYDGESFQMSDDGKTVTIEGEVIPVDEGSGPILEDAIGKLLEKNKNLRERNGKLEKDLRGAVKEEMTTFTAEKDALVEQVKRLKQYEPKQLDETQYEAQYAEIHNLMSKLGGCIKAIVALDDLQEHPGAMARVDGYVEGCTYLANELRELWADQCMFKNE